MLEAMQSAEVGDAVFGDDPTVLELEEYAADLFGVEGALFFPSGTMTNQVAIKSHTKPGDQIICDETAHIHVYEGGGAALHSGVSSRLLKGEGGRFTADQVEQAIQPDDPHFPRTRLVSIENTSNKGGGTVWRFSEIRKIRELCEERGLALHLDGARLFNALAETSEKPAQYGELFDSISICLSKGLGAPVGSLLLGNASFLHEANRMRKVFGGGMRQAGYLAAAGLFALRNNVARLPEDHENAKRLAAAVESSSIRGEVLPTVTNMVMIDFETAAEMDRVAELCEEKGMLTASMSSTRLRFVTHKDVSREMVDLAAELLGSL